MRKHWRLAVGSWQLGVALMLVLAGVSCSSRNQMRKPEVLLNEQQMIDMLTDSFLIEAQLNQKKSEGIDVSEFQVAYYEQLYEHYGITDSLFVQNMDYYTHHPDILERVMDSVMNRLVSAQ